MISARNVKDAHAQDSAVNDEYLLPILKVSAQCTRSLHDTRNACCCQYVCHSYQLHSSSPTCSQQPTHHANQTGPLPLGSSRRLCFAPICSAEVNNAINYAQDKFINATPRPSSSLISLILQKINR